MTIQFIRVSMRVEKTLRCIEYNIYRYYIQIVFFILQNIY